MKKIIMIFIVLGFMCSNLHAATITPGNLLISTDNTIYEYTTQGTYVQSFSTQYPGGYPATEYARDIAADTSGNIFVYNGTFYPYMSTLITSTSSWSHVTYGGFSTVNNVSYGGIDVYGTTVFASDMFTYNGGEAKGVVAFDTSTGQAQRFAESTEPIDLTIGLDGLLYILYPGGSPEGRTIDVYDPSNFNYLRTIDLTSIFGWTGHRSIAVDYNGDIFIADWDGGIHRISKAGNLIATITPTYDYAGSTRTREFIDIDISQNGKIALGTRFGEILLTDTSFSNISSFSVGGDVAFVEFVPTIDTTPDQFTFTDQTNVSLNTTITSNTIRVSGINTATPISIAGGTYSINGGAYTSASGTVSIGNTVTVQLTSSGSYSTTTIATLTIGGLSGTFSVTTIHDTVPDNFTFNNQTNVAPGSVATSNTITVSGIDAASPISIAGGTYSINGGAYTSTSGTVSIGNTVTVQLTSSGSYSTTTIATLTIGGLSGTFSVTTQAAPASSDGEKSGCFIATAAFDSPMAGQVEILRQFRDRYLLTNELGRKFVAWYYRNGPIAAKYIKDKPLAKAAVRVALYPLIGFSLLLISGYLPFVLVGLLLFTLLFLRLRPKKLSAT